MRATTWILIAPLGLMLACAAQTPSQKSSSGSPPANAGESTYQGKCRVCHATGVGGAPVVGKPDDWRARISQGRPLLVEHSLKGFKGSKGTMPPKGGFGSLSDGEVSAAVDYMIKSSS